MKNSIEEENLNDNNWGTDYMKEVGNEKRIENQHQ